MFQDFWSLSLKEKAENDSTFCAKTNVYLHECVLRKNAVCTFVGQYQPLSQSSVKIVRQAHEKSALISQFTFEPVEYLTAVFN